MFVKADTFDDGVTFGVDFIEDVAIDDGVDVGLISSDAHDVNRAWCLVHGHRIPSFNIPGADGGVVGGADEQLAVGN